MMWTIITYEWKAMFRQKLSYFLLLFYTLLLSGVVTLQYTLGLEQNYTYTVTAISHLLLYILPILSLLLSSFAILQEKENNSYALLRTYPLSTFSYVNGKWLGNWLGNLVILLLSFNLITFIAMTFLQIPLNTYHFITIIFMIGLTFFYSLIGTFVGAYSKNKWHGLVLSLFIWLLHIILWTSIIVIVANILPYNAVAIFLRGILFFNPAEYMRLLYLLQFNSISIFGTSHATFVAFLSGHLSGVLVIMYMLIVYTLCTLGSTFVLRGEKHVNH